jgi:L-seryl-tRNA(Ser) seleniumtransferase
VVECEAVIGGGTLPGRSVPSVAVALPAAWSAPLREQTPAVVTRTKADRTLIDLRSVFANQDALLIAALRSLSEQAL